MKQHTSAAFTEELRKIASLRLRAAEVGLGGALGAGAGALSDLEDRTTGAARGAIAGAGGAAVLSTVLRTLLAHGQITKELPKALEEAEAAMKPHVTALRDARTRVETALERAPKHDLKPLPRHADVVHDLAKNKFPLAYGDYRFAGAKKGAQAAKDAQRAEVRAQVSNVRSYYRPDIADHEAALAVEQDPDVRRSLFDGLRTMRERLSADVDALHEGRVGPNAAGSPEHAATVRALAELDAAKDFGGRMRGLMSRRQRASHALENLGRQWASKDELARSEAALADAKAALDKARETHGRDVVRKRVVGAAHGKRDEKLFGVV